MKSNPGAKSRYRWTFRLAAIALGLLPFIALEWSLRFFKWQIVTGYDDPLVDLHHINPLFVAQPTLITVPGGHKAEGELAAEGLSDVEKSDEAVTLAIPESRLNYFRPASFPLKKETRERRIFVLGGSTVQGRPFSTETSFSTWLQLALQAAEPDVRWRCINCGGISYASYRVSAILDEVLQYEPDLIILYTGHNEFLEERNYGTWQPLPRGFAKTLTPLTQLATVRLFTQAFRPKLSAVDPAETDRWVASSEVQARLDQFGGLEAYSRDPEWRNQVIEHFRISLQRMINACQTKNIPLLLCVPVSDVLDTPPFKIQSSPNLTPEQKEQIESDWKLVSSPESPSAIRIDAATRMLAIDPYHSGAAYVGGKMLLDLDQPLEAKKWLVLARDWDVCPLRAPSEIAEIVRQAIYRYAMPAVDVANRCEQLSANGIVGRELLIDHVHPTIETHQKIAKWILLEMASHGLTHPKNDWENACDRAYADHLSTLSEAYFVRGFQRLEGLKKWAAGRAGEMSLP